jgi:hypothetical protein
VSDEVNEPTMLDAIALQAAAAELLGAPTYKLVLEAIAADYRAGGPSYDLLHSVEGRPVHDAIPLRLLSGLHRLALAGQAPELAAQYATCGGIPAAEVGVIAVNTIATKQILLSPAMHENVQTNETGRSRALIAGLSWLGRNYDVQEVQLFEMGASAGLNLCAGAFRFENPLSATGPQDSSITFADGWLEPFAPLSKTPRIVDLHGCDVFPIDINNDADKLKLLSFVWPDQIERFARLNKAIEIARAMDFKVDKEDAATWIARRLNSHSSGVRVAWHSIAWQYFPSATKDGVRAALSDHGSNATPENPLVWLRMEPAGATADLRATIWRGDAPTEHTLALVGYHGMDLKWLVD